MDGTKRTGRARWRRRSEPDVVDLRTDEVVDLRSDETTPAPREYHCMRVWQTVSHDPAEDAWESSVSLVEYPPDLGDLSVDRWRETPEPGPQSAAVLRASLEADALETPDEPT